MEKLRGLAADEALAARQQAEDLAVGGLRDALQSIDKLSYTKDFGRIMGLEMEAALELQHLEAEHGTPTSTSWVDTMYESLGKDNANPAPPAAVQAIRNILIKHW